MHYDIAIIGAGTAGLHAYKAARRLGADVVIIERGKGGSTCTRSGCIPSKLLIAAGRAAQSVRDAGTFGVEADHPGIDGQAVLARVRRERDRMNGNIEEQYLGIPDSHRLHGEASFVSPGKLRVDDRIVEADAIVIAAGASPVIPPALKCLGDLVHTHETIFEIAMLPRRLAVVGAGPIGIELAQAFARLGTSVTLLDQSKNIGSVTDPVAEQALREALGAEIDIHLGVDVAADRSGDAARLAWSGASEGMIEVDMVLAATGRMPDLSPLALDKAGVALDDDGVPQFDPITRRSGSSAIYIAGDIGNWRPVLHEAARGGRIAGTLAAGGEPCPQIPDLAIAFTEPGLAEVGMRFDMLPEGALIGTADVADNARLQIDAQAAGVVRLYGDRDGKLVGATIVAHGAEHLGQEVSLALSAAMSVEQFLDQPWYHPVVEETLQNAARDLLGCGRN